MKKFWAIIVIILILGIGTYFLVDYMSKPKVLSNSETTPICTDPDGLNYNVKGTTYNMKAVGVEGLQNFTDVCTNEVDPNNSLYDSHGYLIEYNCNTPDGEAEIHDCPNGCHDGACK